jgi:hypothetical protein
MPSPLAEIGPEALDRMTDAMSDGEISALYGLTRTAATYARKRLGVRSYQEKHGKRRYVGNYEPKPGSKRAFSYRLAGARERYFERVETPRQAYWLGLLYADGWIVTHRGEPTGFALALHERDIDLLKAFAEDLGCPSLLRRTRPGSPLHQLKLSSRAACDDLISLGVVPRKSKVVELPELPGELMPHFIRGYFDGDGSVGVRGVSLSAQITSGSEAMVRQLRDYLADRHGIDSSITRDRNAFVLRWYAGNAVRLARVLYGRPPHGEIAMQRKREKFFDFLGSGAGHSWEQLLSDLDSAPSR